MEQIIDSILNILKADKTWQWFFSGTGVVLSCWLIRKCFKKDENKKDSQIEERTGPGVKGNKFVIQAEKVRGVVQAENIVNLKQNVGKSSEDE